MNGPSRSVSRTITTTTTQSSESPSMNGATRGSSFCSGGKSVCFSGIAPPLDGPGGIAGRVGAEPSSAGERFGLPFELAPLEDHEAVQRGHHQDDPEHGQDVGAGGVRAAKRPEFGDLLAPLVVREAVEHCPSF